MTGPDGVIRRLFREQRERDGWAARHVGRRAAWLVGSPTREPLMATSSCMTSPTTIAAVAFDHHVWATLRLLDACADLDPEREVVRHRGDGSTSGAPLGVRLAQVPHHGTDHRSQVCTILTTLGVEPPGIDVWEMAWARDQLTETPPST